MNKEKLEKIKKTLKDKQALKDNASQIVLGATLGTLGATVVILLMKNRKLQLDVRRLKIDVANNVCSGILEAISDLWESGNPQHFVTESGNPLFDMVLPAVKDATEKVL